MKQLFKEKIMRKKQTFFIGKMGVAGVSKWAPLLPLHGIVSGECLAGQSTLTRMGVAIWLVFNQYHVNKNDQCQKNCFKKTTTEKVFYKIYYKKLRNISPCC